MLNAGVTNNINKWLLSVWVCQCQSPGVTHAASLARLTGTTKWNVATFSPVLSPAVKAHKGL